MFLERPEGHFSDFLEGPGGHLWFSERGLEAILSRGTWEPFVVIILEGPGGHF